MSVMLISNEPIKVVHYHSISNHSINHYWMAYEMYYQCFIIKQKETYGRWLILFNIEASQTCQKTPKLLMADLLPMDLMKGNIALVKVN